jgi:hypothetical protein
VAVGAAEFLGELDALVEHHAPRHVGAVLEFVHADPHHGVLDGRDFFELAVQQRADQRVELFGVVDRAVQQRVVVRASALWKPARSRVKWSMSVGSLRPTRCW